MPHVPRGPPTEPGFLDLRRDLGSLDFLNDLGRRDVANDPGRRDLADDPGRLELQVLGVSLEVTAPQTMGISGGFLTLHRAHPRSPREAPGETSNDQP